MIAINLGKAESWDQEEDRDELDTRFGRGSGAAGNEDD